MAFASVGTPRHVSDWERRRRMGTIEAFEDLVRRAQSRLPGVRSG
ncbi:MAG: hypothetical protein HKO03_00505 [Acidimicrobiia bacterium]|nr:hypothetical protein [Acidimicrobiia bacterium]